MSQPMDEQPTQRIFGGVEGPDAMYVKLISSDGHEFIGVYIFTSNICCRVSHSNIYKIANDVLQIKCRWRLFWRTKKTL